ncbi:helix-turn-helix domain-containing protein [Nocardiopsis alborubida]|uniref:Helix-turn-helix domain-containing protein n=1 Tax=Nocardiopsis alborubida TaxID=146802 RepID=A0A7X6M8Q6_9ACTN|nr:helix-turn-helix transcriptional regulator [Nocardiopsis alborubida]NKY96702.1 helix-turn-helix domain-containing protein [Nocardiopsis alborubida]
MEEIDDRNVSDVRFGQALTRARKRSGKTQTALAGHLTCSKGHVSHIENGRRQLNEAEVEGVDNFLKAGGRLVRLYSELYEPEHVDWLGQLHELQAEAAVIREYHNSLFPGVLQAEPYSEAVFHAGAPWMSEAEVRERIRTRIERSKDVLRVDGPQYHVVLDDVVVRRPIGPNAVMRAQIDAVVKLAESGRIMLQMHEWGQFPHAGLDGPFSLLASPSAPELVHVESIYRGQTTDVPTEVRQFGVLFSTLQANARTPNASVAFLKEMSKEYAG